MKGVIRGTGEKKTYWIDGEQVTKEAFDQAFPYSPEGSGNFGLSNVRPKLSDALGVHPRQVAEAIADSIKKGVPTEFAPDGRAIIRSRAHQKAYLKAYGFYNRDGGYGD
jgi:hypothetical protein